MRPGGVTPVLFRRIAGLLRERAGMELGEDKLYLLETRLPPVLRRFGLRDYEDLARALDRGPEPALLDSLIEVMTTNETLFFRDLRPFRFLSERVLPEIAARNAATRRLRIWSAAASTGQEAYSLAICVEEQKSLFPGWQIEILGTDISSEAIAAAERGVYTQFEVQRGLPTRYLVRYFTQEGTSWRVRDSLRRLVRFARHNLLDSPARFGRFDVVFLRNVLFYMDAPARRRVLDHVAACLLPGGYLFLGATESLRESVPLERLPDQHAIFRRAESCAPAPRSTAASAAPSSGAVQLVG